MATGNTEAPKTFTLGEMLECWTTAQDSWAKECGGDIDDIENEEYEIPNNRKEWFQKRFNINVENY